MGKRFEWTKELEAKVLELRDEKKMTYREIAEILGTTISSVKHKYIRLNQAANDERHHHPVEKIDQLHRVLGDDLRFAVGAPFILETNAGYGNLTKEYTKYGIVYAFDIDKERVNYLHSLNNNRIVPKKCDSHHELHNEVYLKNNYEVVDLDPYGFPSRYFPHVFQLIEDGYLFVTFPKMGVQQINKITKEHYRVFWGMTLDDKVRQEELIHKKIKDYGFMSFRSVELVDSVDLGRMFRFAYKVKKESALDLVDLKVKGVRE